MKYHLDDIEVFKRTSLALHVLAYHEHQLTQAYIIQQLTFTPICLIIMLHKRLVKKIPVSKKMQLGELAVLNCL